MQLMSIESRTYPGLIAQLKKIKAERHLTNADLKSMVDAQTAHPAPSERTIQKVFSAESEKQPFSYSASLSALVYVLAADTGEKQKPYKEDDASIYYEQLEALKVLLDEKNAVIAELQAENALKDQQIEQLSSAKEYVKCQCEKLMILLENLTANNK